MPETRLESLEEIGNNFLSHRAEDAAILQLPRKLFSTLRRRRFGGHGDDGVLAVSNAIELN